jgi:hypothetical protein
VSTVAVVVHRVRLSVELTGTRGKITKSESCYVP